MSRYIDADDAVERLGAYLMADAQIEYGGMASEDINDWKEIASDILKGTPSIDIVRCKECKHWLNHKYADYDQNDFVYYCAVHKVSFSGKDFCSYGEREGE